MAESLSINILVCDHQENWWLRQTAIAVRTGKKWPKRQVSMTSFTGVSSFPALLAMTLLLSLAARATADAAAVLRAAPLSGAECAAGGVWVASRGGSRGRGAARLKLMAAMIVASILWKKSGVPQIGDRQKAILSLFIFRRNRYVLRHGLWAWVMGAASSYCFYHVGRWMKNSGILPAFFCALDPKMHSQIQPGAPENRHILEVATLMGEILIIYNDSPNIVGSKLFSDKPSYSNCNKGVTSKHLPTWVLQCVSGSASECRIKLTVQNLATCQTTNCI